MELGLELMSLIGAYGMDSERESINHMIHESDGISLCVALVDLKGSDASGIVHGVVLKMPDHLSLGSP